MLFDSCATPRYLKKCVAAIRRFFWSKRVKAKGFEFIQHKVHVNTISAPGVVDPDAEIWLWIQKRDLKPTHGSYSRVQGMANEVACLLDCESWDVIRLKKADYVIKLRDPSVDESYLS